ncbi:MAG: class I SAM-dependent methyltransferase [Opitutales bacterium]|nr:class I SAM-dependent methyltransferase [Opitutales bacterium]
MAKLFEYTWTDADQKDWWESAFKLNLVHHFTSHNLHIEIAKTFKQKLPLQGKFLEYGCGTGGILSYLPTNKELQLYGCADEPSQVETTKQRLQNQSNFVTAELISDGFFNQYAHSFDIIDLTHIWCNVPPAVEQAWLTKILSLLAPSGYLCINDCYNYLPQRDSLCPHCGAYYARIPNVNALTPQKITDTLGVLGVKPLFCKQTTMRADGQSFLSWQLVKWHNILKYHHQDNFCWIGQKV